MTRFSDRFSSGTVLAGLVAATLVALGVLASRAARGDTPVTQSDGAVPGGKAPWTVTAAAYGAGKTTEVLVLNATQTAIPAAPLAGRRALEIQNLGPNDIYCALGTAAAPPTAVLGKSRRVAAGQAWPIDVGPRVVVRCLAATADQVTGGATIASEVQ